MQRVCGARACLLPHLVPGANSRCKNILGGTMQYVCQHLGNLSMWLLELAVLLHNYISCNQVLCTKKERFSAECLPWEVWSNGFWTCFEVKIHLRNPRTTREILRKTLVWPFQVWVNCTKTDSRLDWVLESVDLFLTSFSPVKPNELNGVNGAQRKQIQGSKRENERNTNYLWFYLVHWYSAASNLIIQLSVCVF